MEILDSMRNYKAYNGNTYKFGITLDGKDYIVKYPKGDDLSVFCEYTASRIISGMGIPCQTVYIGNYKGITVDVIEDFTSGTEKMLHSFRDTKQSSEDTDIGDKEYTYQDVTYLIEKHLKLSAQEKDTALHRFWQMFLCDAILANRDRHWGNWGYLSDGNSYHAAPIYDNGACLFPNVNRTIEKYVSDPVDFLKERIYTFPASLFMVNRESRNHPGISRSHRSNYFEILGNTQMDLVFHEEWNQFRRNHSILSIYEIAKEVTETLDTLVDDRVKRFWMSIVPLRFGCLIGREPFETAYKVLMERQKEDGYA